MENRIPFLLTNLVCMAALTVFLLVCGNSISAVLLILVVWAVVLLTGLFLTYWKRKRQMQKLLDIAGQLSERYLISEVMELPEQAEDQVYYQLLKMAGKSMLEQIGEVRRERLEYKEYIEQWIHEIKTPITAMKLLCEKSPNGLDKGTASGTGKRPTVLPNRRFTMPAANTPRRIIQSGKCPYPKWCIRRLRTTNTCCFQSGVRLEVEEMEDTVYSDENGCGSF